MGHNLSHADKTRHLSPSIFGEACGNEGKKDKDS
jgi:hypothetical protein